MINVHYEKRIWKPFTKSFSNAVTPSIFRRSHFNVTFTHWLENPSVWPLQDVITGILYTNCPLLNYLILIAKVYLWGCRRNQTLPGITAFSSKGNYEAEKSICVKTNKWTMDLEGEEKFRDFSWQEWLTWMIEGFFWVRNFPIPGLFWVGKFGNYFLGWFDFFGYWKQSEDSWYFSPHSIIPVTWQIPSPLPPGYRKFMESWLI